MNRKRGGENGRRCHTYYDHGPHSHRKQACKRNANVSIDSANSAHSYRYVRCISLDRYRFKWERRKKIFKKTLWTWYTLYRIVLYAHSNPIEYESWMWYIFQNSFAQNCWFLLCCRCILFFRNAININVRSNWLYHLESCAAAHAARYDSSIPRFISLIEIDHDNEIP